MGSAAQEVGDIPTAPESPRETTLFHKTSSYATLTPLRHFSRAARCPVRFGRRSHSWSLRCGVTLPAFFFFFFASVVTRLTAEPQLPQPAAWLIVMAGSGTSSEHNVPATPAPLRLRAKRYGSSSSVPSPHPGRSIPACPMMGQDTTGTSFSNGWW